MTEPQRISSRDNALLVKLRKLAHDPGAYRKLGQIWIEGEHLCDAMRRRALKPAHAVLTESAWTRPDLRALAQWAAKVTLVPDALFKTISALESPPAIGYLVDHPPTSSLRRDVSTVVLDRLQDAGNVGSILRSAAALGVAQVLALKGTAALWSPKVLRAGMGAHFALHLVEGLNASELDLGVPLVATSSHAMQALNKAPLPKPCAWVFGHEGQGVQPELMARCAHTVRIPQPGGEESLNVAAAAAICLYEASSSSR
jgi:RNA methyltransferase, TrmH family